MFKNTKAFSGFSVNDLQKAKEFYGLTLGLDVTEANGLLQLHIAGGVFKPGNAGAAAAENALFVGHQLTFIVGFELHATADQLVYRLLAVGDRKIQDGEGGGSMVVLGVYQDGRPAANMQL